MVAAVRRWVTMDHESRLAEIEQQCQVMMKPLQNVPGVSARMLDNTIGHQPFGVEFTVDKDVTGYSSDELVEELAQEVNEQLVLAGYRGEVRLGKNNIDSEGNTFGSPSRAAPR